MNITKTLLLCLTPLSLYAGSADAIIDCKSGSGRTALSFLDQDIQGQFQGGTFTVDKKKINYQPQYNGETNKHYPYSWMNVNMKEGVYSLVYNDTKGTILKFYALPKTMEKIEKKGFDSYYKFNGIIDSQTTDPRTSKFLNKQIWVGCTMSYAI
ncbi:MAG: Unknown protein [uncultured Sulfurovum sp.]|uniref:Uncharacterized protein n=1 Tax=uncultured Sulfurovum sp. TaxID=269237 RepID=A0A6S6TYR1_9BACT|nr:MAG: Unknown protein [uncultured Sulfurovum sp.]